jgi:hypothetical protein
MAMTSGSLVDNKSWPKVIFCPEVTKLNKNKTTKAIFFII